MLLIETSFVSAGFVNVLKLYLDSVIWWYLFKWSFIWWISPKLKLSFLFHVFLLIPRQLLLEEVSQSHILLNVMNIVGIGLHKV